MKLTRKQLAELKAKRAAIIQARIALEAGVEYIHPEHRRAFLLMGQLCDALLNVYEELPKESVSNRFLLEKALEHRALLADAVCSLRKQESRHDDSEGKVRKMIVAAKRK